MQAALALTGRAIPGANLFFILAAGDPEAEITCPRCSTDLMAQLEDPPEVSAIDPRLKQTSHAVPISPRADAPESDVFSWLTSTCRTAGYPDVVGRNGLFMVRTELDGQWYYGFVDIGRFVCEYARGHKDLGTYSIKMLSEKETAPKK